MEMMSIYLFQALNVKYLRFYGEAFTFQFCNSPHRGPVISFLSAINQRISIKRQGLPCLLRSFPNWDVAHSSANLTAHLSAPVLRCVGCLGEWHGWHGVTSLMFGVGSEGWVNRCSGERMDSSGFGAMDWDQQQLTVTPTPASPSRSTRADWSGVHGPPRAKAVLSFWVRVDTEH